HTRIKCQNGKNVVESTVAWQSDQGHMSSRFDCSTTLRSTQIEGRILRIYLRYLQCRG
ncbi:hypothetical protein B0H12DRAFT_1103796, partial [Mycena haematopus]